MKIHGKVDLSDYPLQSDPDNDRKGFEFSWFLSQCGFKDEPRQRNTCPEAMLLLETELSLGYHPIISLCSSTDAGPGFAHAMIAFLEDGHTLLAAPRLNAPGSTIIKTSDSRQTEQWIERTIEYRKPKFVDILTYAEKTS